MADGTHPPRMGDMVVPSLPEQISATVRDRLDQRNPAHLLHSPGPGDLDGVIGYIYHHPFKHLSV